MSAKRLDIFKKLGDVRVMYATRPQRSFKTTLRNKMIINNNNDDDDDNDKTPIRKLMCSFVGLRQPCSPATGVMSLMTNNGGV